MCLVNISFRANGTRVVVGGRNTCARACWWKRANDNYSKLNCNTRRTENYYDIILYEFYINSDSSYLHLCLINNMYIILTPQSNNKTNVARLTCNGSPKHRRVILFSIYNIINWPFFKFSIAKL